MSEQTPENALTEEPEVEVEGHRAALRPEELDERDAPDVEGHVKLASPEDPLKNG